MPNINEVRIAGNLTRDPELRFTPSGCAVVGFSVAINRTWLNDAGEKQEETTFVDVEGFGKRAEAVAKYFPKGRPIYVAGRLRLDSWDDKETGQKRTKMKVIMNEFQFVGGDAPESDTEAPPRAAAARPAARGAAPARSMLPTRPAAARPPQPPPRPPLDPDLDEIDDIPFN